MGSESSQSLQLMALVVAGSLGLVDDEADDQSAQIASDEELAVLTAAAGELEVDEATQSDQISVLLEVAGSTATDELSQSDQSTEPLLLLVVTACAGIEEVEVLSQSAHTLVTGSLEVVELTQSAHVDAAGLLEVVELAASSQIIQVLKLSDEVEEVLVLANGPSE